jgi:hypothetical protein
MRYFACVSLLLPILFICGGTASHLAYAKELSTDWRVFEWCLSHSPRKDGETIQLLPRPPGELRPFDLSNAVAPSDLVTKTQIVDSLPPSIEKYQGIWTWPSIDAPSSGAIFVERLTPTEMTIVLARERDKHQDLQPERLTLSWTGTYFSYSKGTPEDSQEIALYVSESGEAMAGMLGATRTVTLIDKDGKESSDTRGEGWPLCFLSEKYYRTP